MSGLPTFSKTLKDKMDRIREGFQSWGAVFKPISRQTEASYENSNQIKSNQQCDSIFACQNIMNPIFSENVFVGFKIQPANVPAFLSHIANYLKNSNTENQHSYNAYNASQNSSSSLCLSEIDKTIDAVTSFINHYCWTNNKTFTPASEPGLFLFQDINPETMIEFDYSQRKHPQPEQSLSIPKRPTTLFSSPSNNYYCNNNTNLNSNRNYRKRTNQSTNENEDEETIDWKNYDKNQYLFHPKIMQFYSLPHRPFPSRFSHDGCCCNNPSRKSIFEASSKTSNNLSANFPPSIRQDFLKLRTSSSLNNTVLGNLPFKIQPTYCNNNNSNCSSNENNVRTGTVPERAPLSYDEYLKRFADERNQQKDLDYLRKMEIRSQILKERLRNYSNFEEEANDRLPRSTEHKNFNTMSSSFINDYENDGHGDRILGNEFSRSCWNTETNMLENLIQNRAESFAEEGDRVKTEKQGHTSKKSKLHATKYEAQTKESSSKIALKKNSKRNWRKGNNSNSNNGKPKRGITNKLNPRPRSRYLSLPTSTRIRKQTCAAATCAVNLTKIFYYCDPPVSTLNLLVKDSRHCFVQDFKVGHEQYGHVTFHGNIDVFGLDLNKIIQFKLKEFDLYPNEFDDSFVLLGQGLKCPATVVMFNVWPINENKTSFIRDVDQLKDRNYELLLRKSCSRTGAKFISYDPDLGHWTFEINSSCPDSVVGRW